MHLRVTEAETACPTVDVSTLGLTASLGATLAASPVARLPRHVVGVGDLMFAPNDTRSAQNFSNGDGMWDAIRARYPHMYNKVRRT